MNTDILIIGGGMVGATLALALRQQVPQLSVTVVESTPLPQFNNQPLQPSYDARASALSYGTRLFYQQLGLWQKLQDQVTPILDIHVSDRGHFGFTRINHRDQQVPALGYVVENRILGQVLLNELTSQACSSHQALTWLCPATVAQLKFTANQVEVSLQSELGVHHTHAKLVVLAEGGRSNLSHQLGLEAIERSYQQHALVTNISSDRPHNNVAYERFTDQGPMAMLPLSQGRSALVWTMPKTLAEQRMHSSDQDFLADLQQRFGYRLGRLTRVGERYNYPLSLKTLREQVRPGLVVLGNAAHTLHPVAGQGYNLCLRDLMALTQVLAKACAQGQSPGELQVLQRYYQARQQDQRETAGVSDLLVRGFSNANGPLSVIRNLGLTGLELTPPLKRWFARQAMGLRS